MVRDFLIETFSSHTNTHDSSETHCGVFRLVPVWNGHVVVMKFPWDPFTTFSFPENRVEIGEVMMNVQTVLTPATQRPAAHLGSLTHTEHRYELRDESGFF